MESHLNFYEFAAVLMPGALAVALFAWAAGVVSVADLLDLSLGSVGLLFLVAYAVGLLVQPVGWLLEVLVRREHPTSWPMSRPRRLFHERTETRLLDEARRWVGTTQDEPFPAESWPDFVHHCRTVLQERGSTERIQRFLANYSAARMLLAIGLISTGLVIGTHWNAISWAAIAGTVSVSGLAFAAMVQFDRLYARELFLSYLAATEASS